MLTAAQIQQRDGKLTASRVACLMTGNHEEILNLWREMIGDPDYVAKDLSDIWAVQLGSFTEALNLEWYTRRTGRSVSRMGDVIVHPGYDWAACTLDGWDDQKECPIECKHVGGREPRSKIIERYKPQFHWQALVTQSSLVILSLIEGSKEPVIEEIALDSAYELELLDRANQFMTCVRELTPPVA